MIRATFTVSSLILHYSMKGVDTIAITVRCKFHNATTAKVMTAKPLCGQCLPSADGFLPSHQLRKAVVLVANGNDNTDNTEL